MSTTQNGAESRIVKVRMPEEVYQRVTLLNRQEAPTVSVFITAAVERELDRLDKARDRAAARNGNGA